MSDYDPTVAWSYRGATYTPLGLRARLRKEGHVIPIAYTEDDLAQVQETPQPVKASQVNVTELVDALTVETEPIGPRVVHRVTLTFDVTSDDEQGAQDVVQGIIAALNFHPMLSGIGIVSPKE